MDEARVGSRRTVAWLATAAAVLTATAAVLTAAGSAVALSGASSLGIRLLDAPSDRRNDPRALVYIIDRLAPGTAITRHLEVDNDSDQPHHVELYPDAASITGGAFVVAPGRSVSDLTTWITMSPSSLDMGPHDKRIITTTIAVPTDASPGERYGVLLAAVAAPPGVGVRVASRVGIRVYLSVGAGAEPASDFTIDTLTASRDSGGSPLVTATVHNTGGRALDMRGSLLLTNGPGGLSAGPFAAKLGSTLAPGDTEPVLIPLDKVVPDGPWDARVELQSGLLERIATATIRFPAAAGSPGVPVRATEVPLPKHFYFAAITAGVLLGLVLLMLVLFLLFRRRGERLRAV